MPRTMTRLWHGYLISDKLYWISQWKSFLGIQIIINIYLFILDSNFCPWVANKVPHSVNYFNVPFYSGRGLFLVSIFHPVTVWVRGLIVFRSRISFTWNFRVTFTFTRRSITLWIRNNIVSLSNFLVLSLNIACFFFFLKV